MSIDIVTGADGFIGSHLVDRLLSLGRKVLAIDYRIPAYKNLSTSYIGNKNFIYFNQDIAKFNCTKLDSKIDTIYHLAALADIVPSIEDPAEYYRVNVTGTLNMLEAARACGCRKFVYAASSSCYGIAKAYPTKETDCIEPMYPYALTKHMGEQLVMHWNKVYGIPAISLRLFNVYGPRARTNGTYGAMFGVFLAQIANGAPLTIVGDGTQMRDFTYVSDVIDAFVLAAESQKSGEVYNVGCGASVTVNEIAERLGGGQKVYLPKRPGEPHITWADARKIKTDLGWEPRIPIAHGVKIMLDHLQEWKDAPVWDERKITSATREWFRRLA